jgi:hypothetical protein
MTTYSGGCHCGKVRYQVTMDLGKVISCNCSMCGRKGTLLSFAHVDSFALQQGEGEMTSYKFNKMVIDHLFCSTCGVTSFARGKNKEGQPIVAINTRCLDGVDPAALDVMHFDGKSR